MYKNDVCQVKLEDGLTKSFLANQGVKQGCILSPLLFNIFLADLPTQLSGAHCNPVKIDDFNRSSCIAWADDIVLLSESEGGLQCMLDKLSIYCKNNGMQINADKTKAMIFNRTGKYLKRSFKCGNEKIFTTNSYKYLGFIITPSGELTSGLTDLKNRALKAYYKLKKIMGFHFRKHVNITLHLFDSLIKPILIYNSDFWGCLKMPANNPIENMHMRFCKELLGVQRQTSNTGTLLELGRIPLMLYGKKNCIKNWGRIQVQQKGCTLIQSSHQNSVVYQLMWPQLVNECLSQMGIGGRNINESVDRLAMQRMTDTFHQNAFAEINKNGSKLRTYAKIKKEQGLESYLNTVTNVEKRIHLCKIRLSNHELNIEKGRHRGLEVFERECPLCPGHLVENEIHFLLSCSTFSTLREELFTETRRIFPRFQYTSEEQQMVYLLSDEHIVNFSGTFVQKAIELRRFLLNKHKNIM